jgi:hypothetical protein
MVGLMECFDRVRNTGKGAFHARRPDNGAPIGKPLASTPTG